jgi:hypothetical protein
MQRRAAAGEKSRFNTICFIAEHLDHDKRCSVDFVAIPLSAIFTFLLSMRQPFRGVGRATN